MNKTSLELISNEWSVPYWLLGICALILGGLSYLVQKFAPAYQGVFTNGMFVVLLVLLSIFYRKLYTTQVLLQLTASTIDLEYRKLLFPSRLSLSIGEIRYVGLGTTEEIKGWFKVPEKHWILLESKGKKYFFYGVGQQKALKGVFHELMQKNPEIVVRENIFK
jgi:hypothetical protein